MKKTVGRKNPKSIEKGRIERSMEDILTTFIRLYGEEALETGDLRVLIRRRIGTVTARPAFWNMAPTVPILTG